MDDATRLKEEGNALFKIGQFAGAAGKYTQAEQLAPDNPVYPSNLSAAFYELGEYQQTVQAIMRAECKASTADTSFLARLSTRLAKTLSHGVRGGNITAEVVDSILPIIDKLRSLPIDSSPDFTKSWAIWEYTQGEMQGMKEKESAARRRLAELAPFKKSLDDSIPFFTIGHDIPMSIVNDWGLDPDPLLPSQLTTDSLPHLALLFGGVGDGRHAYGSIIGLHKTYLSLGKRQKSSFRVHLTLLDIQPTALARDLVILLLLNQLTDKPITELQRAEIMATAVYTFAGVLMPYYCYNRFQKVVQDLLQTLRDGKPSLPPWLHIVKSSIPGIVKSLNHWKSKISTKTVEGMLANHDRDSNETSARAEAHIACPDISSTYSTQLAQRRKEERDGWLEFLNETPDEKIIAKMEGEDGLPTKCPGRDRPRERTQWLSKARELMADVLLESERRTGGIKELSREIQWYEEAKVYVPPPILRKMHHPAFEKVWPYMRDGRQPTIQCVLSLNQIPGHVKSDWKPNPSLFVRLQSQYNYEHRNPNRVHYQDARHDSPAYEEKGYPDMHLDPFRHIRDIHSFCARFSLMDKINGDHPSFHICSTFFEAVVNGLIDIKHRMTLEILHGELAKEMVKMKQGVDTERPVKFPRRYTRVWLSNIPDYTHGLFYTALYIVPVLQENGQVCGNCVLNPGVWSSGEEFCHTYTLLTTKELPHFLGCRALSVNPFGRIILTPETQLPRRHEDRPSHEQLNFWLSRCLLAIIRPGQPLPGPVAIRYPNNLVAFINLMIHLHSVGFPGHWLSSFIDSVLSNKLVTGAVPYLGRFPIPVTEQSRSVTNRKLNLHPWLLDFENILTMVSAALPFPVSLPDLFPKSVDDFGLYQVQVSMHMFNQHTAALSIEDCVLSLMFLPSGNTRSDEVARRIEDIVEGRFLPKEGDIYFITSIDTFDMYGGVIRWRMSKARANKMKREGWSMGAYRFDVREEVIQQIPASWWNCIDKRK
ncbi:hypothetical protein QCA50_015510 [Cerrena zonata]|uniref:DUF4470 domain-containing protein n=1 Tax=Cerrena zonata TaxID=2478898 RepID=A0AAW0FJZ5_9APHY